MMRTINEHKKMIAVLALLLVGGFVWNLRAGDLNPPGAPTGTMRTLNEIYAAAFEPVVVPLAEPGFSSMYLFLTGIPGECIDKDHTDWIDPEGYTFHVENGAIPKAAPHPKFSNLLIAKETDLASVPLMLKACNNTTIAQVILERTTTTTDYGRVVFYRLTLTNARVTYIAPLSARTPLREVVAFGSYDTIKWEYRPLAADGKPGDWQTEIWDVAGDGGES